MENSPQVKRLYRSGKSHLIAGVCGGFSEYFAIDVTLVRIAWLLFFFTGIGFLAYLMCLILMPFNPDHIKPGPENPRRNESLGLYIGLALIFFGGSLLARRFDLFDWRWLGLWPFQWHLAGSIILILIGIWLIFRKSGAVNSEREGEVSGKRLLRSRTDRMIGGVCKGLSNYWTLDVTLVRLAVALLTITTSFLWGILIYIILLIVIPEE